MLAEILPLLKNLYIFLVCTQLGSKEACPIVRNAHKKLMIVSLANSEENFNLQL